MTKTSSLNAVMVGLGAGLASGLLFVSLVGASLIALPLFLLSPLPLFIAALGWGTKIGLLAGGTTLATAGLVLGLPAGIGATLEVIVPALILSHLVGLARAGEQGVEWYPLGRVVAAAALIIGAATVVAGWLIGFEPKAISALVVEMLPHMAAGNPDDLAAAASFAPYVHTVVRLMPVVFPASWMLVVLFALWLAARILARSGRAARPEEDIALLDLPRGSGPVFVASVVLAFVDGPLGLVASVVAGVLFAAHFLIGMAVIAVATRGSPARMIIIAFVYGLVLLFTVPAVLIALIGLVDPLLGFRRRVPPGRT